jgi:Fe-Mn family superoxide dismutase
MSYNRRHFLYSLGVVTAGVFLAGNLPQPALAQEQEGPFILPPLPYAYNALEPYIDEETMKFHHDKHHAAYTKNLNTAVNRYPELKNQDPEDLLRNLNELPTDIRETVRNNGGGYVNHQMFWSIMTPESEKTPQGNLAKAIKQKFGSVEAFQSEFNQAGMTKFGSGWAWLVLDQNQQLQVINTANQDSPLTMGMYPIMGNDVWEHAYYLKYKNDRAQYLSQWWNIVNWTEVNNRFEKAKR